MNRKSLPSILTAAALSFLLAYGGIRSFATAFEIDISLATLILHSCVWSLGGAILFARPKGGRIVLCILALLAIYLWRRTQLIPQILQLCYRISRLFGSAYGFGWLGRPTDVSSVALPLYIWAGLNGLISAWCLTRRRFTAIAIGFSLLPLGLCLVLTDTIPSIDGLFALLLGLILILLTQDVRRRDADQSARLIWLLSGPVALALVLLFVTNPQASYNKQHYADRLGDALLRAVDRIPYVDINADGSVHFSLIRHIPNFVDLQYQGANSQLPIPVMEVTADSGGTLYLRGRDYDTYTGTQWNASSDRNETFTAMHRNTVNAYGLQPRPMGTLTIKTAGARASRYLPYYPEMVWHLQDGACNNPSNETTYSYDWYTLPIHFENAVSAPVSTVSESSSYAACLQLPDSTRSWAEGYLQEHLSFDPASANICDTAAAIAGLVRESADYDLTTPAMPDGREDFARWFLEESYTGYCVHFASATTVLLRAAGIPARYVEGYLTETLPGDKVTVTEKDAHAWAEYYVPGIGWIPLESTAAALDDGPRPLRPTEQTTQPTEGTTAVPTVTEAPTAAPTITEAPTDATADSTAPSKTTVDPTDATNRTPGDTPTDPHPSVPAQIMPGEEKSITVSPTVLTVLGIILLLVVQYPIRLRLQQHYLQTGDTNSRALKHYAFACRLARLLRQTPPEDLQELALRAKFSQHTLTEKELACFDAFRSQAVFQLRRRPWWQQIAHRFFWAAY